MNAVSIIAAGLLIIVPLSSCPGQVAGEPVRRLAEEARTDLAVPGSPAAALLGVRPDDILRPATVRELAVASSGLFNRAAGQSVAVEVAPALLCGGPSLSNYRRSPFLYRLRVSAGCGSDEDGNRLESAGIRMTFVDKSDPRTDPVLTAVLLAAADSMNRNAADCIRLVPAELIDTDSAAYERRFRECYDSLNSMNRIDDMIRQARNSSKKRLWNAAIAELGAAAGWIGDSAGGQFRFNRAAVWFSGGMPVAGHYGQLLFGLRWGIRHDIHDGGDAQAVSGAFRMYAGRNGYKGFIEGDLLWEQDERPAGTLRAGGEMSIANGIWLEAVVSFHGAGPDVTDLSHALTIRFGTPGEE